MASKYSSISLWGTSVEQMSRMLMQKKKTCSPGYHWKIFLLTHWFRVYFPRASSHPTDGKLKNRVVQDFERCGGSNNQGEDKDSENLQFSGEVQKLAVVAAVVHCFL